MGSNRTMTLKVKMEVIRAHNEDCRVHNEDCKCLLRLMCVPVDERVKAATTTSLSPTSEGCYHVDGHGNVFGSYGHSRKLL
ncbi:hypothetical protein Taro_023180 [Colocasia esculenta]|uniref:Uncharacterized protein n=1 Tax=Colocasia esculenta TaxID=4460 RepID=A0A843V5R1_COLES|nr:hypothetical protein [Colocasia esculenta]